MTHETVEAGSATESASTVLPDGAQLWLVRHGETEWSRSGRHTGRTDLPLLPEGEEEARRLRPRMQSLNPALVLCSPRQRARHTAELAGLQVSAIDDDLAEWDYGDYEGVTSAQIRTDVPGWNIFKDGVKNGETIEQVSARADRVIARAIPYLAQGPVVFVAHGHISRIIGARWIGLPASAGANLLLGTAAPSVLGAQYGIPALVHWNMVDPSRVES